MTKKVINKTNSQTKLLFIFYKEIVFTMLALMSVFLLGYEYLANPSEEVVKLIYSFDFIVAILFLTDFCVHFYLAKDKKKYFKYNWYFLLASIPLVYGWAEILRTLRILGLIRLFRAGEHLKYSYEISKSIKR